MIEYTTQHTLRNQIKCSGVGVHSGMTVQVTLKPAPVDHGISFIRTDITDKNNIVPARWDAVVDTQLCTVLSNDAGVTVGTVEHLLSALYALGVNNAIIELDAPEVPIMDGSAEPFVFLIECIGVKDQFAPLQILRIKETISYEEDGKIAQLSPSNNISFAFEIDFDNPIVGNQKFDFKMSKNRYKAEISQARTFGFLHEVEMLRNMGLARGGSLENAIVIDGDKILNESGLRYKNEFVRHKILDAIGDLFLAGYPILGAFTGVKAGHAMNNKVLHSLFANPQAWEIISLGSDTHPALDLSQLVSTQTPAQSEERLSA